MKTIGDIRRANLALLVAEFDDPPKVRGLSKVAELADTSTVYLDQILNRRVDSGTGRPREMGSQMARRLEAGCCKPDGWMDESHAEISAHQPQMSSTVTAAREPHPTFAGLTSKSNLPGLDVSPIILPLLIDWGAVMQAQDLPARFTLRMPDDALSPSLAAGTELVFDRTAQPGPGKGVLVRTADGQMYVRRYAQGLGRSWRAEAIAPGYISLDAARDGLELIAVLTFRGGGEV